MSKIVILNQSYSKKYVEWESSIAIRMTIITRIVLKNEPEITLPVDNINLPPSFLPIVSQTLNIKIVMRVYHLSSFGSSKNDQ